ncbi:chromosome segregation protein SMC [Zavarzinella formosa]|uniref:chromosome segregation protein SMC n=1 Tax=Zavarzinella formosa TaxID=360055 RepID=UPI0002DA462D|nr:chromosome segregation protein SMC [Zavarzinella formosa]
MLKRLELIGFKSFADRTWFDFPAGMSAIVGPNGSGKSNVVDAVRWILGEQSAKNLRGGEMADVIFNGASGRRGLNNAEVTLTFDNSKKLLNTDAAEVAVTRRVYRDGTGEYQINGQQSRLKDIRELFLGSGAGSTAYCIIEQGRVDALLQASTKDRRAILEEAAGISRFKAKKLETLRKLDATQENLNRLRDILGEVETRLRRVRLDAEKAKRFQEYHTRLKDLRIGLSLREYHTLSQTLSTESARLDTMRAAMSDSQIRLTGWESELEQLAAVLAESEQMIRQTGEARTESQRQIATLRERWKNDLAKAGELHAELLTHYRRAADLKGLLKTLAADGEQAAHLVAEAEGEAEVCQARVNEVEAAATEIDEGLSRLRRQVQDGRDRQYHLVGRAAALANDVTKTREQLDRFKRDRDRKRREHDSKSGELATVRRVLESLGLRDTELQTRIGLARQALQDRRAERDVLLATAEQIAGQLEDLRVRRSDLMARIDILDQWDRNQEGLGTGVRDVLAELGQPASPFGDVVLGLVADSLRVPRELAPLIDTALGDVASHFVVRDGRGIDNLLAAKAFSGRVSFLPLLETQPLAEGVDTLTADRWVTCERPSLAGLPRQLLGKTLIVDSLAQAREYAADPELTGFQFVTRRGDLLRADGTLSVGPVTQELGILSRKSELRELREQAAVLDGELSRAERQLQSVREQADLLAGPINGLDEEIRVLSSNAANLQTEMLKQNQQQTRLTEDIQLVRQEWEMLEEEIHRMEEHWQEAHASSVETEKQSEDLKTQLETADHAIRAYEQDRQHRQQDLTTARVAMAETAQRLETRREAHRKTLEDLTRGTGEAERMTRHGVVLAGRVAERELAALRGSDTLAVMFHAKETSEARLREAEASRAGRRDRQRELEELLRTNRSESEQKREDYHRAELAVRDAVNARDGIATRLHEEYQLDLATEYTASPLSRGEELPGEWDAAVAAKEADDLRKKIRHLGNVSLESLDELAEVEGRASTLQGQVTDLTDAEASLRAIILKINEDSKRLFAETYATVRGHFQELFRKLFGGGLADIILENPEDVLETGIDIVARPPGKELRSISLMSGGEKTLTAVALLLAIFQSKPSPFCLLDEVDAALDEANTERLARTLREFTDRSQFIVITHKKRTMAYADVLYGVTMQESGISKQVSVRFEDWPEENAIPEAHAA